MGKAARRKEERRIERRRITQSAQITQTAPTLQQTQIIQYHPLRHAISWADLSKASPVKLPIQEAANDPVIEALTASAVKQRKKPGPKPKPLAPEVRQAQLWALYADLWDEMEEGMSPKERKALQRALQRNSGTLDELWEDDDEDVTPVQRSRRSYEDEEEEKDTDGFWNDRDVTLDDDFDPNY